ncbi:amidase, partial [Rhodococcus sp. WS4]
AGSIRIPAAFNGVTGLKPTFGRVPRTGVVPLADTLDHVGPMARSAADCALLLEIIAGHTESDRYSSDRPCDNYSTELTGDLSGLRIGVDDLDRYAYGGIDAAQPTRFTDALSLLARAGATLSPVRIPMYEETNAVTLVTLMAEAHSHHRTDLAWAWEDYGLGTRVVLSAGDSVTAADYLHAQRIRRLAQEELTSLFDHLDLIVTPTSHLGAPRLDQLSGLAPFTELASVHTPYWSPLGHPVIAVPVGPTSENTPLSISVCGPRWEEKLVLRAADAIQKQSTHHWQQPPRWTADAIGADTEANGVSLAPGPAEEAAASDGLRDRIRAATERLWEVQASTSAGTLPANSVG